MALINCPNCGKNVSDHAINCIHCGFSLKPLKEDLKKEETNNYNVQDFVNDIVRKVDELWTQSMVHGSIGPYDKKKSVILDIIVRHTVNQLFQDYFQTGTLNQKVELAVNLFKYLIKEPELKSTNARIVSLCLGIVYKYGVFAEVDLQKANNFFSVCIGDDDGKNGFVQFDFEKDEEGNEVIAILLGDINNFVNIAKQEIADTSNR